MVNGKHGQGTHSTKMGAEIPQMPQNLSAQIVCRSPKVWDFKEKRLHLASVVRGGNNYASKIQLGQLKNIDCILSD